jgi:hypothetical protein
MAQEEKALFLRAAFLRRWAPPCAVALLGHTALVAVVLRAPVRERAAHGPEALDRSVERSEPTLEIEREPIARDTRPQPLPASEPLARANAPVASVASRLRVRDVSPAQGEPAAAGHGEALPSGPEPPAAPDEGWSFSPVQAADVTAPAFVASSVRDQASQSLHEGKPKPAGGLTDALDARDAQLGLGHGGPVLSALEAATRSTDAPIEGAATFDIAIDTSGRVSVAVSDASSQPEAWSKVGNSAASAVDVSRMHVPSGIAWHVVVKIDAHLQFPDGRRPKDLKTTAGFTPLTLSKTSMVVKSVPGFTVATQGKVCGVKVSLQLNAFPLNISGGCSPENAGMPASRIVSGHIVDEGRL